MRAQGVSDTQIQAQQWLMIQSYGAQASHLSPAYMPAAFPAVVVGTAYLMWWVYCATHEAELAQTKDAVLTWVSGKTGLQKGTIEDIYQGGKLAVDMAQLVVGGLGKEVGKPLLKKVFKQTLHKEIPDATLNRLYDDGKGADYRASAPQGKAGGRVSNTLAKSESPVWKELKPYKSSLKTNGLGGSKQRYYEWDHLHNDIEVFDRQGKHLGSMDPVTGKMYKPAVPERSIKDRLK